MTLPSASAAVTDERSPEERLKAANRRTGLLLAGIALLFFVGIILTRLIDDPRVSPAVMGGAAILFLLIAIGRHLRK